MRNAALLLPGNSCPSFFPRSAPVASTPVTRWRSRTRVRLRCVRSRGATRGMRIPQNFNQVLCADGYHRGFRAGFNDESGDMRRRAPPRGLRPRPNTRERVLQFVVGTTIDLPRMCAHPTDSSAADTQQRDRMLRRLIGLFAIAAFAALGMAVTMASWQRNSGDSAPVSLAQDRPL